MALRDAAATQPVEAARNAPQRVELLPYDDKWLASAEPGNEWLHPQEGFNPSIPAIKVAIKHDPAHALELQLNGAKVSALNYEGALMNAAAPWRCQHGAGSACAKATIVSY